VPSLATGTDLPLASHRCTQDEDRDGSFTVDELIKWIDEHKLVKFVEEGRDVDMDRILETHSSSEPKEDKQKEGAAAEGESTGKSL